MKKVVVFIDCGDTLVDEATQIFDGEIVQTADLISGADTMLKTLCEDGYRIALVADGRVASFNNIIEQHGLAPYFETRVISESLNTQKPDKLMFETAMKNMNLSDPSTIVMIGNNLERDIVGANNMGIISILIDYSPRYRMTPNSPEETPKHTVTLPMEIPALLRQIEETL